MDLFETNTQVIDEPTDELVATQATNKDSIRLWVAGRLAGSGSKTAYRTPQGKMIVSPASKYQKPWQEAVKWAFFQSEYARMLLLTGPVVVDTTFVFIRPKSHFGTGKNADKLKASAPVYPATKPDIDKLTRSTNDALTGLVWKDDSQIVRLRIDKRYGERSGAHISIGILEG